MHEGPITSEKGNEASGEIGPEKKRADEDRLREVGEEIRAVEMQLKSAVDNYRDAQRQMQEIKTGPKSENLHDINLELLNALQNESDVYKERHAVLERQLDELKEKRDRLES